MKWKFTTFFYSHFPFRNVWYAGCWAGVLWVTGRGDAIYIECTNVPSYSLMVIYMKLNWSCNFTPRRPPYQYNTQCSTRWRCWEWCASRIHFIALYSHQRSLMLSLTNPTPFHPMPIPNRGLWMNTISPIINFICYSMFGKMIIFSRKWGRKWKTIEWCVSENIS